MIERIILLIRLIRKNKLKVFTLFVSVFIFIFLLFPFDDLGDLVTSLVSKGTNNSVFVQFDHLNLSLVPQPGVALNTVHIETMQTPPLTARELVITPSLMSLIMPPYQPFGHVAVRGIFTGDVDVWLSKGPKAEGGKEDRYKIELKLKELSLAELRSMASLPVIIKGKLSLDALALADKSLVDQPEADLNLNIYNFEMPSANVPTEMGPLPVPDIKFSNLELKGKLAGGNFVIEKGSVGKEGDEISGTVKGNLQLRLSSEMGGVTPRMGGYNFELNLLIKKGFQDKAQLFLSLLDKYKAVNDKGAVYKLKVSAPDIYSPPQFSAIQ